MYNVILCWKESIIKYVYISPVKIDMKLVHRGNRTVVWIGLFWILPARGLCQYRSTTRLRNLADMNKTDRKRLQKYWPTGLNYTCFAKGLRMGVIGSSSLPFGDYYWFWICDILFLTMSSCVMLEVQYLNCSIIGDITIIAAYQIILLIKYKFSVIFTEWFTLDINLCRIDTF